MKILNVFKHKVVQGTLWYSVVGLLTSGMSFILLPVMTRWMAPDEFGILNSTIALSQLLLPFVTVGLGAAVVRYLHTYSDEPERFDRFFNAAFWFQVLAVTLVSAGILASYTLGGVQAIAGVKLVHMIPVLLLIILNPPRDLGNHLLTAEEKHGRASINQLVAFAVGTILSLWLIGQLEMGAAGRLYGRAVGALVAALMIFQLREVRSRFSFSIDWRELKVALKFGVPYIPYAFAMAGMLSADKLILQYYMDMESVGIYSAAKTVALGMSFIFLAVTRAWYPRYYKLRDQGEEEQVLRGQWSVLCLLALTVSGFVILAPVVYPLLVGGRYLEGGELLPTLALGIFGYGLFMTQTNYISYLKQTVYLPFVAGSGALASLLLSVWLVPRIHMQGAAVAMLGGYTVMNAVLFCVSVKLENRILERVILPGVSIMLAIGGVFLGVLVPVSYAWIERLILVGLYSAFLCLVWYSGLKILSMKKMCV